VWQTLRRVVLSRGFLLVAGALIGLGLCEALLRWVDFAPDYWDWHGTRVELDPELLYRLRGHSRADLNRHGYRDRDFSEEKAGRKRLLMSGDSFLFGDNVAPHQTLPRALQRSLGGDYQVFNLGVAGDGPDQSYARLLRDGLALEPDAVALALYPANDFNDLAKNRLYVFDDAGRLVFNADNPVAAALPTFRTGVLLRKLLTGRGLSPQTEAQLGAVLGFDAYDLLLDPTAPDAAHKIRLMRGVLRLFRDTLAARGVDFCVLILPSLENIQDDARFREAGVPREQYFANEAIARRICEEEGIDSLDLRDGFLANRGERLYLAADGHLSVRGNLLAARALAEHLRGAAPDGGS
jgi:hypothetical protein